MCFFSQTKTKSLIGTTLQTSLKKGKLQKIENTLYQLSYSIWRKKRTPFLSSFVDYSENSKPFVGLRRVKIRGTSLKIPYYLDENKWLRVVVGSILSSSSKNKGLLNLKNMFLESIVEINAIKEQRKKFHEMANQYKVFAHNRWF